jgi:uncharacterized protein YPO0396
MIELRRIILVDWYLFRVEQIDLGGMIALIGPNGAGKSAVIDAVQTVLTGANMLSIRFNPSAQSATRSKRSIRDYCLGVVSLDDKGERSEPTRDHAYSYAVIGLVDSETGAAINLGVAFAASATKADEICEARFMIRGALIAKEELLEPVGDGEVETRQWHAVRMLLRDRGLDVQDDFGSASDFVSESLRALSPPGFPLNPVRFIKAFKNALLLRPVDNPTDFVRNYVLDVPTIQIDRLRRSIELYRFLTGRIENLKAQTLSLTQIQRIVARTMENERVIHLTDWQIARLHWERFRREVRELQSELKRLRDDAERKNRLAVAAAAKLSRLDAECTRIELTLKSSDAEQLASMYESDRSRAVAERENAIGPLKVIEALVGRITTLAERRVVAGWDDVLHGLLSSVTLAHKPAELGRWATEMPDGWDEAAEHLDAALTAVRMDALSVIQKLAADCLFGAQKEAHVIQDRIDQIDVNLKRLDEGLSAIEAGTTALLKALKEAGIQAEPLCDLVEVRDQKWRVAAEAALGRSREALIVEANNAVRALEIYRHGSEDAYRYAEIVNTTRTAQTRPHDKGSLASVITTENRHARAFLDFRLGRLMMVETMEKIVAFENAITPDRMMQSGRTAKRLSHPGYLKLGRGTAEETRRLLQDERTELLRKLAEKTRTAQRLKEDSSLIDEVVRGFVEMRTKKITCIALGGTLATFDRRIAELAASVDEAKRSRDPKLVEEQQRLKSAQEQARRHKELADKAWQDAHGAENRVAGNYEKVMRDDFFRLREARRARARSVGRSSSPDYSEITRFEAIVRNLGSDSMSVEIEGRIADVQRRITDRRPGLQRELSSALLKHCQSFSISLPFSENDAEAEVVGPWAISEKQRLEGHELVKYEAECRNAAGEMTTAFRDDLLHRLHDAFEGIKETLSDLNRHLKDREFHGRDYYSFKSSPAGTHADLIELVQESRRPEFQLPLFTAQDKAQPETAIFRAMRRIEQILGDPEAKPEEIEDPRKYFNFELFIQDEHGKIRSSLTSRAGTGSGGEGQLPFYIAIGASLAATYQNRRTGQTGLALAIFDEAFNRLDSKAICACSDFMKALGLQVVVATPDEKRHVFMEVADTVVNVNRSGNTVLIDAEYLTEKTRAELSNVDPYRKGFDGYKAELIAASIRPGEPEHVQREAAE